ncbi:hypothetical protein D9615_004102 [Tricholomella constricta]|uniref:GATA-type domain-containing protein n=1 Tax=Tricholomella constricta TaxID=117010 RepID=A0A8H5HCQ8_9AGAR|nr:hypothetical protein D9615_004102 [Tricholomella constricta]
MNYQPMQSTMPASGHRKAEDIHFIGVECDVSSEISVQKAYAHVMNTFGRVDSVVASAGIVENYTAFDYPADRMKRLYDINVHGVFYTAREAARNMVPQGGGSIVLVSSMSANLYVPLHDLTFINKPQTPYNASKAAVKHMAASLAVEWAKTGVRVNALSPGYMLTKLTRTILENDPDLKVVMRWAWVLKAVLTFLSLENMGKLDSYGKELFYEMGEPEDLAGAIVFLASDASKFMTGSEIRVDGGYCVVLALLYGLCITSLYKRLQSHSDKPNLTPSLPPLTATFSPMQAGPSTPKTFEFTKRKRWADLLAIELADGINLILSASCTVLYCAPAITDITGWKEPDILDHDFLEIVATSTRPADDQASFRASFDESMQTNSELHSYIRVKCSEPAYSALLPKGMLFEVKGQPRSAAAEGVYFFATIKPFPSQNTALLKYGNDRLQHRRLKLSNQLPQKPLPSPLTVLPSSQIYATSPIQPITGTHSGIDAPGSYYPPDDDGLTEFDTVSRPSLESALPDGNNPQTSIEDESEDGSKRKKLKKAPPGEHYVCVTCGRTDSPEWRKGPLGPKTLCNACGLRWAKQTRTGKVEDVGEGYDA